SPAVRERLAAVEHPCPVRPFVNLSGEITNFCAVEILPAGEHSAKQNSSVDGRYLAIPHALGRIHVHKMEKESVIVVHLRLQELQRRKHPLFDFSAWSEVAFVSDAKRRQAESRRSNAGDIVVIPQRWTRAVFH